MKLKLGDMVRYNGRGVLMTVGKFLPNGKIVCVWFRGMLQPTSFRSLQTGEGGSYDFFYCRSLLAVAVVEAKPGQNTHHYGLF
ncbi:MAG TPA: hypothetical protein V6C65_29455 [Allocoleopsis sp.]